MSFSELRLIRPSSHPTHPAPATPPAPTDHDSIGASPKNIRVTDKGNTTEAAAAAADDDVVGPSTNGGMPVRSTVPKIGTWAELSDQLERRKAELACEGSGTAATPTGSQKAISDAVNGIAQQLQQQQQVSQAAQGSGGVKVVPGINMPGAVKPRGGVRASAMGPMLAFLRSSGGLQDNS